MKAAVLCIIGLVGSWGHAAAESLLQGRVRLDSGTPVPGAQVLLFDLGDLRAAPLAATTDRSGQFTLSLATLGGALPEQFELGANYPNPFNPSTMIPYQLPVSMHVRLEVFNILGQRVATLVDGERPAGFHTASWDATDAAGEAMGAGVYLYRLSGEGVQATRSMLLIDGQAGIASGRGGSSGSGGEAGAGEDGEAAPVYGLAVSGPGLVPYVDPAFRVQAGMAPLDLVVEAPGRVPPAKAASSGGILGDVDNTGDVDFFDALLVALYSHDSSTVMPNNGDISLGDVDADGQVDLSDAWAIAAYLNDPSDPSLPAGIGEPAGPAASLSPDPSTVAFIDDGSWHRFTVQAGEPVSVVANPEGTPRRLEITTRSGRGNYCPAAADDDVSRQAGQTLYLAGCTSGQATVELRRESDGTVLRTYTFEVTGSPADLVVESVSVSDSTLTPGQSFTLSATVRNQGTAGADATTLRWYRSSNRRITTRDTQVGTDAVGGLGASRSSAESISLTAPSSAGTYYYGACAVSVAGESVGNNCSTGVRVRVEARSPDLIVETASVSDSSPTPGQSFTLSATVRNQGTGQSAATTLRYYRSTDATISTQDPEVGTGPVDALAAAGTRAESINLTAESSEGTYYYGACVESVAGEADTRNNCSAASPAVTVRDGSRAVAIPDANLRAAIAAALGKARGAQITVAEMKTLTSLSAFHMAIRNLTGLDYATNLTWLELINNTISDVSPLRGLTNLTYLGLGGNTISDVSPLRGLTNLTHLRISWNTTITDISPLSGLTSLTALELGWNTITDISPLSGLTSLTALELTNNTISDVSPLRGLTNLTWLGLRDNRISDLAPLAANTGLGSRDAVDVNDNPLNATSRSTHIPALRDRGVRVAFGDVVEEIVVYTDPQIYEDNVFVMPVEENIAALWTSESWQPEEDYTARFYEHFRDEFDFLILIANVPFEEHISTMSARFIHANNDVQGIGLSIFSNNKWGSAGKLQGVIDFPYYDPWHPLGSPSELRIGTLLHELMHRWAAFLNEPLVYGPHWNPHSNIGGSVGGAFLPGSDFEELVYFGGSRYTAGKFKFDDPEYSWRYVPLELYLAGLIPPEEVSDTFWAAVDGEWLFDEEGDLLRDEKGDRIFTAREIRRYTIDDIIGEHGPRIPDHLQSQKDFRAAVILLVSEDYPATREILEDVSADVSWFSHAGEDEVLKKGRPIWNFYEATGGRGTITMDGLSDLQHRGSAKRLAPSSFGTPPPHIVDIRE